MLCVFTDPNHIAGSREACICMCIYVCVYMYVYICMCIYVCVYMYVYICMCIYVCVYVCTSSSTPVLVVVVLVALLFIEFIVLGIGPNHLKMYALSHNTLIFIYIRAQVMEI